MYTVFFKGHINVTKIKTIEELPQAVEHFCSLLQLSSNQHVEHVKVDNIVASGKVILGDNGRNFHALLRYINRDIDVSFLHANRERFPGCRIKLREGGTILLFNSGKYVITGVRTILRLDDIFTKIIGWING